MNEEEKSKAVLLIAFKHVTLFFIVIIFGLIQYFYGGII